MLLITALIRCELVSLELAVVRLLSWSSSFRRAPSKIKNIYYQDTKEKDQKIFSHMACFCHTGVTFEQY